MISKKLFTSLQKDMEAYDAKREKMIILSRVALKAAKKAIYALHRSHMSKANELLKQSSTKIKEAEKIAKKDESLLGLGILGDAKEEFVEASLYQAFQAGKAFPTPTSLGVRTEHYLSGVSDLVGELVRAAINASIKEEYARTVQIKDLVSQIYGELMLFDFRNSPLRRKFDAIKYGLEKLEDLILNLKLRGKI